MGLTVSAKKHRFAKWERARQSKLTRASSFDDQGEEIRNRLKYYQSMRATNLNSSSSPYNPIQ
jgi:hypothetical protein